MNTIKWHIDTYRSKGFLNRSPDKGRVYIDLPIEQARELHRQLTETPKLHSRYVKPRQRNFKEIQL